MYSLKVFKSRVENRHPQKLPKVGSRHPNRLVQRHKVQINNEKAHHLIRST